MIIYDFIENATPVYSQLERKQITEEFQISASIVERGIYFVWHLGVFWFCLSFIDTTSSKKNYSQIASSANMYS